MFLGIKQCPLRPTTIFAHQYVIKLYAVRAANENVVPRSCLYRPQKRKFLPTIPTLALLVLIQALGLNFCQFQIINADTYMWIRNYTFLVKFLLAILKNCKVINPSQFSAAGLQDWGSQISGTTNKILSCHVMTRTLKVTKQLLPSFQQDNLGWSSEYVEYSSWLNSNI